MSGLTIAERLCAVGITATTVGGVWTENVVVAAPAGGALVIIAGTADEDAVAIGVYERADSDGDPVCVVDVGRASVVDVVRYLLAAQPEGTDWAAWATQRLEDEGEACGRDVEQLPDDRLYLDLKGALERLCRAQTFVPAHWRDDVQRAIDVVREVGSAVCPAQWSEHDQPEYPEAPR